MQKTVLITGSTDGIGFETAKMLLALGHNVIIHGRSKDKVEAVKKSLSDIKSDGSIDSIVCDLSIMANVVEMAESIKSRYKKIDALINNAGIYGTTVKVTQDGIDTRFAVNTIAPYLLTKLLLDIIPADGRIVNLSSAAQSTVDLRVIDSVNKLYDGEAYAQSKLAVTMLTKSQASKVGDKGPVIVAINPRSMLGSKMVMEAYGVRGGDLRIGADILTRAVLSDEFSDANGHYFDNDRGIFSNPHPDALDNRKIAELEDRVETILGRIL